jgi:ABC-2 type transport system ATP-binding protein
MRDMRLLVHRLAAQGITVMLSSHVMAEVEELCDRVAIISHGTVRYEGSLHELIATTAGRYELRTTDDARALEIAAGEPGVRGATATERGIALQADADAVPALTLALAQAHIGISALVPRTATLEELFFRMTEGAAAEALDPPASAEAPRAEVPA